MRALLCWIALALVGCAVSTTPDASSAPDATLGDDSATDSWPTASDASPLDTSVPCSFVSSLDRSCSTDADCASGLHHDSCCGADYIGFRATQRDRFTTDEIACYDSLPDCGCYHPTGTDSGETVSWMAATVQVGCVRQPGGSVCLTYIAMRPPDTM